LINFLVLKRYSLYILQDKFLDVRYLSHKNWILDILVTYQLLINLAGQIWLKEHFQVFHELNFLSGGLWFRYVCIGNFPYIFSHVPDSIKYLSVPSCLLSLTEFIPQAVIMFACLFIVPLILEHLFNEVLAVCVYCRLAWFGFLTFNYLLKLL